MCRLVRVVFLVMMLCSPSWARDSTRDFRAMAITTNYAFFVGLYSAMALFGHWRLAAGLAILTLNPFVITRL